MFHFEVYLIKFLVISIIIHSFQSLLVGQDNKPRIKETKVVGGLSSVDIYN